jgi:hypothetical protein
MLRFILILFQNMLYIFFQIVLLLLLSNGYEYLKM